MKNYIFVIILFSVFTEMYSQNFEYWPTVISQSDNDMKIQNITLNANETLVTIYVNKSKRSPLVISKNMILTTNEKLNYNIRKFSIGNGWLKFGKKYHPSSNYTLFLYFDKIPETTSIDIDDSDNGGLCWKGITLKKVSTTAPSTDITHEGLPQEYKNINLAKRYITDNILELDPIEGIYDVELVVHTSTGMLARTTRQHFTWIVLDIDKLDKNQTKHCYIIYSVYGDDIGYMGVIRAIQKGIYYVLEHMDGKGRQQRDNFTLQDWLYFQIANQNYYTGIGSVSSTLTATKSYPQLQMYQDAIKRRQESEKPSQWSGTGFALASNYVVTNYHVVEEAKSITIQGVNGDFSSKYAARVVATDKINDIAILKVDGISITSNSIPYSIKTTTSEVGEDVFVLGYPLTSTMGDEIKLTTGVISSKSGFQGDVSLYQISAPIQPGNSGGPLFDSKGNIIGIVSSKHKGAENVGYAIKCLYLRNLIESSLPENILPHNNKISEQKLSGKVKSVKNYVFYIVCSNSSN